MKKLMFAACSFCAVACFAGCSRESGAVQPYGVAVAPIITRVSGLNFESGDEIGLTMTRTAGVYADNVRMVYDGTLFTSPDLIWYDDPTVAAELVAYYPYEEEGTPTAFRVASDQSVGMATSDLLGAVKSSVTPTESAVGMVFRHLMASVRIVVTNTSSDPLTEVWLGGTILDAEIDLATQRVAVCEDRSPTDIRAWCEAASESYRAVIVPQCAALTLTVVTASGLRRSVAFEENDFLSGKYYEVSLLVDADHMVPILSGEVTDWEAGDSLSPQEPGPDGENGSTDHPDGDDVAEGELIFMGESYPTVVIGQQEWMASNLRYEPDFPGTGWWYPEGSSDRAATYGVLYDYDTAQALCPEGWRLPTESDFEALCAALEEPYEAFVPLAGLYTKSAGRFSGFGTKGCLMGSTPGTISSLRKYLQLNTTGGVSLSIQESQVANGVSVRFVRDIE